MENCYYCAESTEIKCSDCGKALCNNTTNGISHIIHHLVKSSHCKIKCSGSPTACTICSAENLFRMGEDNGKLFCTRCRDLRPVVENKRIRTLPSMESPIKKEDIDSILARDKSESKSESSSGPLPKVKLRFDAASYITTFVPLIQAECQKDKELKESMRQEDVILRFSGGYCYFSFKRQTSDLKINASDELRFIHKSGLSFKGVVSEDQFTDELKVQIPKGDYPKSGYTIECVWRAVCYERMIWALEKLYKDRRRNPIFKYILRGGNDENTEKKQKKENAEIKREVDKEKEKIAKSNKTLLTGQCFNEGRNEIADTSQENALSFIESEKFSKNRTENTNGSNLVNINSKIVDKTDASKNQEDSEKNEKFISLKQSKDRKVEDSLSDLKIQNDLESKFKKSEDAPISNKSEFSNLEIVNSENSKDFKSTNFNNAIENGIRNSNDQEFSAIGDNNQSTDGNYSSSEYADSNDFEASATSIKNLASLAQDESDSLNDADSCTGLDQSSPLKATIKNNSKNSNFIIKEASKRVMQVLTPEGFSPLNKSQEVAVRAALEKTVTLIQGPPGTGKTYVSAVAVYNLVKQFGRKVLVVAPSNTAVDQLAEKINCTGLKVLRIMSKCREAFSSSIDYLCLHTLLQEFESSTGSSKTFLDQAKHDIIETADVVCCTCISAGQKLFNHHSFPFVLIDEAVQSTEPLSLIPCVYGAEKLVLVGDHKQLGPTILSKEAIKAGFGRSLFERLLGLGIKPYMLSVQYRMHSELCKFPSEYFYNGQLKTGVVAAKPISFPNNFFYVCTGKEEISQSGTSFVNKSEAVLVENIIRFLFKNGVLEQQIGVITPYEGQRSYILGRIFGNEPGNLEIKNVDGFQGREKDYIIVSLVRSNNFQGIGFVADKRRMNVTLTRARHGLIIVGNPFTLYKNKMWANLLNWYDMNGNIYEGSIFSLRRTSLKAFDLKAL